MDKIEVKIRGCKDINSLGDFIRANNIKLILFGEYHGFPGQISILRKIVKNVGADFFLYEMLEEEKILNNKDTKIFLNKSNNTNFSFISTYGQLKPIIRLARDLSLPIIGCDLKNMGCKDKDWRKNKFSREEGKRLTHKRELKQVSIINKYVRKGIVFTLLGCYHLRKNSLVLPKLKSKKVIIIRPSFKWNEKFNHPGKIKGYRNPYIVSLLLNKS